jgi:hypothetical protein
VVLVVVGGSLLGETTQLQLNVENKRVSKLKLVYQNTKYLSLELNVSSVSLVSFD